MNRREAPVGAEEIKKEDILREADKLGIQWSEGQEKMTPVIKKSKKDIVEKVDLIGEADELTKEHHYKLDDKVN